MSRLSPRRWRSTWARLGAIADDALYTRILAAYSEPHRHYHTSQHLDECLAHLDDAGDLAEHPAEVELAIWFHDAVYDPTRKDNEERSADWAIGAMADRGLPGDARDRVASLILATRHAVAPSGPDEELLIDVDLAILGAGPDRFAEYDRQIRAEYSWVPRPDYRRERAKILDAFLARPILYSTPSFRERFEPSARRNLAGSLERLRDGLSEDS